jgi:hypothetical protein
MTHQEAITYYKIVDSGEVWVWPSGLEESIYKMPLKRREGYYATKDGRYVVLSTEIEGEAKWYWQDWKVGNEEVHDHYFTKAEAVSALAHAILEGP